ncbi:MAG: hypothetical protein K0U98_14055 [Deltaproteobacteria bacterium]|nr:hypothetical protein [Deltaproteobacteria bacterium]
MTICRAMPYLWRAKFVLGLTIFLPLNASAQTDCAVQTEVPQSECETLLAIYHAFDGPNWGPFRPGWNQTNRPCLWSGVDCISGQVSSLSLQGADLVGTLPAALGGLPALRSLALTGRRLQGAIPVEVYGLSQLTTLNLFDVQISEPLSPEIGNLVQLENLTIQGTDLPGSIPVEIGDLAQLEFLSITGSELTGSVPAEIGNLQNLRHLSLRDSRISSVPLELGNLSQIEALYLNDSLLTSVPWAELGSLPNLILLELAGNEITGGFPMELIQLPMVQVVDLSSNHLSGPVPAEVTNFNFTLQALILEDNDFSGSVPSELAGMGASPKLNFKNNKLSNEIPVAFGEGLVSLFIDGNCISSSDPLVRAYLAGLSPGWESSQCLQIFDDDFHTGDFSRWSAVMGDTSPP